MKFKNLVYFLIIAISISGCKNDDDPLEEFDPVEQAVIDDNKLVEYLQTHYLNESDGGIWTITGGQTPLSEQVDLMQIESKDIDYKLYYLVENPGTTESPSRVDSVLTTYTGMLLDSSVFDSTKSLIWFSLSSMIEGWSYGFTNFKGGDKIINDDESFEYENFGKGYLFIPSGLGYANAAQGGIPPNSPLVFQMSLQDINIAEDDDNDGVVSYLEDLNRDRNFTNDDSDGDGEPNYLDEDDDGDGKLTKNEDTNGDGDYFNDDSDGDGIPDFLDSDS